MDNTENKDCFEVYLENFLHSPSLILVRSIEAKNFPYEYIKEPILDLCCGDGFFGSVIGLNNYNTIGCDLDENALKLAKLRGVYKEVRFEDARILKIFSNNFFNTVISNCALEHVDGIELTLNRISQILQVGGVLIMTVPSNNLFQCFPLKNKNKLEIYNRRQQHLNILEEGEWVELLKKYNLKVEQKFYIFNQEQYKKAIFLDALPEILPKYLFNFYKIVIRFLPKFAIKYLWRKILKQIYLDSKPLECGGELVIVAKKL